MQDGRDSQFIDELLDTSLAQYRSAQPRAGLENRILARLRAEPEALPWLVWVWRIGAGLAAVGIVLVLVSLAHRQRPPVPVAVAQSPRPKARPGVVHASTPRATPGGVRRRDLLSPVPNLGPRTPAFEPRRDVFPSPAPLTENEKLLLSFVRRWPDEALAALPEDDRPVASLTVPELKMPPLETQELSSNTTDETR